MVLQAGGVRVGVGVEAGEGGKQAGVDVQHAAGPACDEVRGEQTHPAGQAKQLDAVGA